MTVSVLITDHGFEGTTLEESLFEKVDANLVTTQATSPEDLFEIDVSPDALLVQYVEITDAVFSQFEDLKVVGRYGIGTDNIDLQSATEHDVPVVNVPSYCEEEVATHALTLLLNCARRISQYSSAVKRGNWNWRGGRPIIDLREQTLGLVGFGNIPRSLVEKANAFGLEPIAYDPYRTEEELDSHGVEKVTFDRLLSDSDFISIHAPLNEETRELFDDEAFQKMNDSAFLINTARGEIVDIDALADAIREDTIAGAGLDVLPDEPPTESPLFDLDEVLLTPHVAWYSEQSIETLRQTLVKDVLRTLAGNQPRNVVNDV